MNKITILSPGKLGRREKCEYKEMERCVDTFWHILVVNNLFTIFQNICFFWIWRQQIVCRDRDPV